MSKAFLAALALILSAARISCDDQSDVAKSSCRSIHGVDVDDGTTFHQSGCILDCWLHGKVVTHHMTDGIQCPFFTEGKCQGGVCVTGNSPIHPVDETPAPTPKPTPTPAPETTTETPMVITYGPGHLDVTIISAQLEAGLNDASNTFVRFCIQKKSVQKQTPVKDLDKCNVCTTPIVSGSASPAFNWKCPNFRQFLFSFDSRLSFDVFDQHMGQDFFLGSAAIEVAQLMFQENDRDLTLTLKGGSSNGATISVHVKWSFVPQ